MPGREYCPILSAMPRFFDLALMPVEASSMEADCYVVVDLLRATTTIAVLFERGLDDLIAVDDIDLARTLARAQGRLLFGEVGGLAPPGFDHGNSPVEAARSELAGRGAVLFTTNGTRALCALGQQGLVVTGALANISAVVGRMGRHQRTVVVCAGTEGGSRFALEDFAAAGIILRAALRRWPGTELGDAAGLAVAAPGYEDWIATGLPQPAAPSGHLVVGSRHARLLASIGLSADIQFALREDTSRALPTVVDCKPGQARLIDAGREQSGRSGD
jgi:2-phosphosulfolactate phosphatase